MHKLIKPIWTRTAIDILLAVLPIIARAITQARRRADGRQSGADARR